MEVVITSLDALIQKATNASLERPDPASVEAFCTILSDSPNGAHVATRIIASRIRSNHPTEALLALDVLDACMKRCDVSFRVEVDKFRFLNEMIKLVSPKYYGNKTAPAVKQKVLNLMHSWTVEYPRELKIRDAYEMLKKQGVVKDIPSPQPSPNEAHSTPKPKSKDVLFQDDEKARLLQKLLQSKNPEDIQAANRLIKTMVKEDERRVEAVSRRITELQTVHNNARLLDEMLDQYKPGFSSVEDLDLIKELHAACVRLRPTVFKLAAETQHNEEMLNDVLEASDELTQVFNKYSTIVLHDNASKVQTKLLQKTSGVSTKQTLSNGDSLLDFNSTTTSASEHGASSAHSNLEVLGDIFSSVDISSSTAKTTTADILKPISLVPHARQETKAPPPQTTSHKSSSVLDDLGTELLKASALPSSSRLGFHFNNKESNKTPMNLLGKIHEKVTQESSKKESAQGSNVLDLDFLISKTLSREYQSSSKYSELHPTDDEFMVDLSSDEPSQRTKPQTDQVQNDEQEISLLEYLKDLKNKEQKPEADKEIKENVASSNNDNSVTTNKISSDEQQNLNNKITCEVKALTDINIGLENITPGDKSPVTAFEEADGISVILHFAKNKPRPDVSVIVLTVTSRNKHAIQDFKFHAVVPKGCKVRLLPPSGDSFPVFNPFLPPAAITQVMLIARPIDVTVFLKFVITYLCEDDIVTEMGEVSELPLENNI